MMFFSGRASGEKGFLQIGQRVHFEMHFRQKECPQSKVRGMSNKVMQIGHVIVVLNSFEINMSSETPSKITFGRYLGYLLYN